MHLHLSRLSNIYLQKLEFNKFKYSQRDFPCIGRETDPFVS